MVLAVKLLVTFIKMRIFYFKHNDDLLGEISGSVLGSILGSIKGLFGAVVDEDAE